MSGWVFRLHNKTNLFSVCFRVQSFIMFMTEKSRTCEGIERTIVHANAFNEIKYHCIVIL